jgi:hypothetical protein
MMGTRAASAAEKLARYRAEARMAIELARQTDDDEMRVQLQHIARVYGSMVTKLKSPPPDGRSAACATARGLSLVA